MDINWATGEITVYKTDPFMTFVGGNVYNMDTNGFRLALKDREDDPIGMVYPDTHSHNTTVLLGGIEYARIVEILAPYTITFSDAGGAWVCNLIGSNNNILDKANLTTVQIRSNNSAGLIQTQEIEHASFNGGVTVDALNGVAGTAYPIGTTRRPVNNMADAKLIAQVRGFNTFYVQGNLTLGVESDIDGFVIEGENPILSALTIGAAANVQNCTFRNCTISGVLDGGSLLDSCTVNELEYINGELHWCMLNPVTISLGGMNTDAAHFLYCFSGKGAGPVFDLAGDGPSLLIRNYSGTLTLTNKTGNAQTVIDLNSGKVVLDTSVTTGVVKVRGVGEVVDILGNHLQSGTWNGGVDLDNDTIHSNVDIAEQVWATPVEGTFTAEQVLRLVASFVAADGTGLNGSTPAFKSLDGTKTRIAATFTGGSRTITSRDAT